jgi:hypothetical protein
VSTQDAVVWHTRRRSACYLCFKPLSGDREPLHAKGVVGLGRAVEFVWTRISLGRVCAQSPAVWGHGDSVLASVIAGWIDAAVSCYLSGQIG